MRNWRRIGPTVWICFGDLVTRSAQTRVRFRNPARIIAKARIPVKTLQLPERDQFRAMSVNATFQTLDRLDDWKSRH
jgi:hypothetical protein